jgi:hypothetical protein
MQGLFLDCLTKGLKMLQHRLKKTLMCACLAAGIAATFGSADAALTITLQDTAGKAKASFNATSVGKTFTFDIVANVTGNDGTTDEGLQSFYGSVQSILTNGGSVVGDFSTVTLQSPFTSNTQGGTVQDLNNQPGLDVGSNDKSVSTGYVYGRDASMDITPTSTPTADSSLFLIGVVQFTVNSYVGTGTTNLIWVPRTNSTGAALLTAAVWKQDGVNDTPSSTNIYQGDPTGYEIDATPEPASLGLLGLGGLAMLRRRRTAKTTLIDSTRSIVAPQY